MSAFDILLMCKASSAARRRASRWRKTTSLVLGTVIAAVLVTMTLIAGIPTSPRTLGISAKAQDFSAGKPAQRGGVLLEYPIVF